MMGCWGVMPVWWEVGHGWYWEGGWTLGIIVGWALQLAGFW